MNLTGVFPEAANENRSSITDDAFIKVANVTEDFIGDIVSQAVTTHVNVTYNLTRKLTNVTGESLTNLIKAKDDVGICDFIIGNFTSGNVTTTVASYDPAACGVYGSYPALRPLLITILVCFTLWAIFGNGCLVLVIASDKNMQEPGNIFLCAMGFTDIAQSLTYTPIAIHSLVRAESPGGHACRIQAFFVPFLATLSIYLQTCLWVCRYVHIAHPFNYQSVLKYSRLALAMGFCFLIALAPPLVGLARVGTVSTSAVDMGSVDMAETVSLMLPCTSGGPESNATVVLCVVGLVISCCFGLLIFKVARDNQKKHNQKQAWIAQADKLENKLKAAKTLGIVVGVQWVSWIPVIIVGLLGKFGSIEPDTTAFYGDIVYVVLQTTTFSDSIVYAFRNKIYRRALAKIYRKIRNAMNDI